MKTISDFLINGKITKQSLFDYAVYCETMFEELLVKFPPGTLCKERSDMYYESKKALECYAYMENNDIEETMSVGPYSLLEVKRGDKVKIRAGAEIETTHPKYRGEKVISRKSRVVTINYTSDGFVDNWNDPQNPRISNKRITWAGSGGYWFWTDANNIL